MTTNHCPNSIKTKKLALRRVQYDGDDFESYYLPAQEIDNLTSENIIPLISLERPLDNTRPVIAVILAVDSRGISSVPDYSLHPDYAEALISAGGEPVFISYDKVREQLEVWQPQGILLIGGDFAFPTCWFKPEENYLGGDLRRAEAYLAMLEYAKEKKLPVLGICGGEQMLAGFAGAGLRGKINSGDHLSINHRQGGYILAHEVEISPSSKLEQIVGATQIRINSCHHEAVRNDQLGDCIVTATAPDGTVEAIELNHPWHPFVLGVQWHPERLAKLGDPQAKKLFKVFVKEAANVKRFG